MPSTRRYPPSNTYFFSTEMTNRHFSADEVAAATGCDNISYLGTGSFGETWRLHKDGTDQAWKFLYQTGYDTDRLAREIAGLERVDSPRVVRLDGLSLVDIAGVKCPTLIFEYVPGGDLSSSIALGVIAKGADLVKLAHGLLVGIEALHSAKVVHRDIKPANIGLRNGQLDDPVLLDLGLAKLLDLQSITRYPGLVGTAMYAAPEQLNGERASRGSDMWALGGVLYEAATGNHPFFVEGERLTLDEAIERQRMHPTVPTSTPTKIKDLIHRCLAPEIHRRGSARRARARLMDGA